MDLVFEWDGNKARTNVLKHNVTFEEATTVFADERSLTIENPIRSLGERRFVTMGTSAGNRVVVVVHTERNGRIRIISARPASRKERRQYHDET